MTDRVARLVTGIGAVLLPELAGRPADLPAALVEHRPHTLVVGANHVASDALRAWTRAMRSAPDRRTLLVIRRGTSLAEIDLATAAELGVVVRNTPEVNARHVARFMADHLFAPRAVAPKAEAEAVAVAVAVKAEAARVGAGGVGAGEVGAGEVDPCAITVGLVGGGDINSRVAREAVARGHEVVVHSPSLAASPDALRRWLAARRLPAGRIRAARDLETVLDAADVLGLAVPLTTDGEHPTAGLISVDRLKRFGGYRIVSVCEPAVFTDQALTTAYDQLDLEVVLDNAPRLTAPVRALLAGRSPADDGRLRPGFAVLSAAMRAPECAVDLDQAMLAAVARAELDDRRAAEVRATARAGDPFPLPQPRASTDPMPAPVSAAPVSAAAVSAAPPVSLVAPVSVAAGPVTAGRAGGPGADEADVVVVGGGIVGLTVALGLHEAGRRVVVLDAAPGDRAQVDNQGTTFAGTNGRHLSATETLPHADAARAGILDRAPAEGGWRLRPPGSLSAPEAAWAEAFERFTDRPGMRAVATELVIALNRLGLRRWEDIFAANPDGPGSCRRDARLPRVYLDKAELAAGRELQARVNARATDISAAELARHWPALGGGLRAPDGSVRAVQGAVEVDGYAVGIHDLATSIGELLRAGGVPVLAGARVRQLRPTGGGVLLELADGTTVRADQVVLTVGGRDLYRLLGGRWPGAASVAHVLGVSLTLPNPGLARPLKVHAGDPVGVINVTLSPDGTLIHISGGFGYLGLATWRGGRVVPAGEPADGQPAGARADGTNAAAPAPDAVAPDTAVADTAGADTAVADTAVADTAVADTAVADTAVAELLAAFTTAVGELFPTLRGADGRLDVREARTCERPMTADGMPLVTAPPELGGRVVVAVGTNAGGAVQAPALADLVVELLDGRPEWAHLALAGDRTGLAAPDPRALRAS